MEYAKENIDEFFIKIRDKEFKDLPLGNLLTALPACNLCGPWVCGGALRRTLDGGHNTIYKGDIDYFCYSKEQAEFLKRKVTQLGLKVFKKAESAWASTYKVVFPSKTLARPFKSIDVQVIHGNYWSSIQECMDSFHYTICQFGYDGSNIYYTGVGMWDIKVRELTPTIEEKDWNWSSVTGLLNGISKYADAFGTYKVDEKLRKKLEKAEEEMLKSAGGVSGDPYEMLGRAAPNFIEEYDAFDQVQAN
jgi:hypothetical protein